jgi:hypothetical protein
VSTSRSPTAIAAALVDVEPGGVREHLHVGDTVLSALPREKRPVAR